VTVSNHRLVKRSLFGMSHVEIILASPISAAVKFVVEGSLGSTDASARQIIQNVKNSNTVHPSQRDLSK